MSMSRSKLGGLDPRGGRTSRDRSTAERTSEASADVPAFERNISAFIAGTLGREIVGGVYPVGSLLPSVDETCARFSASRTALREAYSVLAAKALIAARPKVGTRVRPRSDWNMFDPDVLAWHIQSVPTQKFVADLFVLREMVEPAAAALAASLRSQATVDRIADAYARMQRFKDGSGDLIEADLQFHSAILEATANPFLTALSGSIHASLQCTFRYSWEGAARIQESRLLQHGGILSAIRDGLPEVAKDRMTTLLRDSLNDVKKYFRKHGAAASERAKP
jgi:GntR family transcriptional regulator, galactonate operon transcriptional repressor